MLMRRSVVRSLLLSALLVPMPAAFPQTQLPSLEQTRLDAEKGDPKAQNELGKVFLTQGDYAAAFVWFTKSAGEADSQYQLAQMLLDGKPKVPKDPDEAIRLLLVLANQGHQNAQYDLARYYGSGKVVSKDLVEAYKWCKVLKQEKTLLYVDLNGLVLGMTHEQILEAEKRANDWMPHKTTDEEVLGVIYMKEIVLKAIAASAGHRMAIINGRTFQTGEEAQVNFGKKALSIRCLEIRDKSAVISIQGIGQPKEIWLATQAKSVR